MTAQQAFRQANAFAMVDGLKFGLYWCFGFICMVRGFGNESLTTLGMFVTICAPILGGYLAHRFEKQVRPDGAVKYGKAYLYSALLYFYASVILALVAFAYFNWFDNGLFASSYAMLYNSPEMQEVLKQSQMDETLDTLIEQGGFESLEQMIRSISPVEIAASLFNINIMLGLLMAVPTALFALTKYTSARY